ncbi:hypothetical protein ACTXT7_015197, partial [Hymenolepis weldensis]
AAVMSLCPDDSKPLSVLSKGANRFSPFYNHPDSLEVHLHSFRKRVLVGVTHISCLCIAIITHTFACHLPVPTLPSHLLYSPSFLLA